MKKSDRTALWINALVTALADRKYEDAEVIATALANDQGFDAKPIFEAADDLIYALFDQAINTFPTEHQTAAREWLIMREAAHRATLKIAQNALSTHFDSDGAPKNDGDIST